MPTLPGSPTTTTTTGPPTTTTTAAPLLPNLDVPAPPTPVPTTAAPRPAPPPPPPPPAPVGVPGNGAGDTGAVPADAGPFPPELAALSRSVKRTGPRNTRALVDALAELEGLGVPREEALRVGMGQFPVGGYANYSHDWWFPRFGPGWRLHQGTDIFADRGTPVRAPAAGVIRFAGGGLGGIAAYVVQSDGTYYYLAHLDRRPDGQRDGQAVQLGDTVGYVGTSGNAEGGTPHLHFEYHPAVKLVTKGRGRRQTTVAVPLKVRPGAVLPAVDPKAFLDLSLVQAQGNVGNLVATYRASHDAAQAAAAATTVAPGGSVDALAASAGLGSVQAAAQLSPAQTLARFPLAAFAFVLVLLVGSLTPVLAPSRSALPGRRTRRARAGPAAGPTPSPPLVVNEPAAAVAGRAARRTRRSGRATPPDSTPA
ncbi:MAG: M23 family metallopeptidase [Acidimicrobiales bacterium]